MDTLTDALIVASIGTAIGILSSAIMHIKNPYDYHKYADFSRRVGVPGILGSFCGGFYQYRNVFLDNVPETFLEYSKHVAPEVAVMTGTAIAGFEATRALVHKAQTHLRKLSPEQWAELDKMYYAALEAAQDKSSHRFTVINMTNDLQTKIDGLMEQKQVREITDPLFELREKADTEIKGPYVNNKVFELLAQIRQKTFKPGSIIGTIFGRPHSSRRIGSRWIGLDSVVEEEGAGAFVLWDDTEVEYFGMYAGRNVRGQLVGDFDFHAATKVPYVQEKPVFFQDEITIPCFDQALVVCAARRPSQNIEEYKRHVRRQLMKSLHQYLQKPTYVKTPIVIPLIPVH